MGINIIKSHNPYVSYVSMWLNKETWGEVDFGLSESLVTLVPQV